MLKVLVRGGAEHPHLVLDGSPGSRQSPAPKLRSRPARP